MVMKSAVQPTRWTEPDTARAAGRDKVSGKVDGKSGPKNRVEGRVEGRVKGRGTGRVTLADVAHAAGVSPITVSRALRGERAVDSDLVLRVQQAARKLGYAPNPAARALASGQSSHVAVLIPSLTNALFVDLLEATQRALRQAGYQTLIGITHYDPSEEETLLREQLLHRPAGLLVTGTQRSDATRALIAQSGVPCVHLMESPEPRIDRGSPAPKRGMGRERAGAGHGSAALANTANNPATNTATNTAANTAVSTVDHSTTQTADFYSVGFSQASAGAELTRHLLSRGYRRIAFAAAQLDPRTLQRLAGWRAQLQTAGLYAPQLEWLNPAPSSLALGSSMFEQIMGQQPPVDAIFFCNDDLAQGALLAALRMGVAVPQRVAVAGFNDLTGSDQMLPPLTTVRTPRAEIGHAAAVMLLALMRGESPPEARVDLGYSLVVRQST